MIALGVLATVVLASVAGGWWLIRDFEENFSCPSEEWVSALAQEIEGFLPEGASVADASVIDCDDRRTLYVTVKAFNPRSAMTDTLASAAANGWRPQSREQSKPGPDDPGVCTESEFQGLPASVYIEESGLGLQIVAGRNQC